MLERKGCRAQIIQVRGMWVPRGEYVLVLLLRKWVLSLKRKGIAPETYYYLCRNTDENKGT